MIRGLTKYWFVIYVLAALLVLAGFLNLGIHYGPRLEDWLITKLIPEIWHSTFEDLLHRLFREELKAFLITTGFGLGIVLIGITLFPLKEKLSATYEEEHFPDLEKRPQPPLWEQGLEEVKLALLYLLLQGLSLFLAVQGLPFLAKLGTALSLGYLVAAMALDHCAPFFQRRERQIHGIIWILLRHAPLRSILLGLACIGPVILLERQLPRGLSPTIAISLLVFTEVLGMACATLLGCHLGATLVRKHPGLADQSPPRPWTISYRSFVLLLFLWMAIFFAWWIHGASRHHRFLQCRYRPLWPETSFQIRQETVLITLPMEVRNPTSGQIDPTELLIEVSGESVLEGSVVLAGPVIEGQSSAVLNLSFQARLEDEALLDLSKFLRSRYSAHLILEPPLSQPVRLKIFPQ